MKNIIIPNQTTLEKAKKCIASGGAKNLHLVSDFDRTITKAFVDGEKVPSMISVLRDGNYLTEDYAAKAQSLFDKYHPIEIDPNISKKEKRKAMEEWWRTHFKLMVKSGLSKSDLLSIAKSKLIKLRKGVKELLELLNQNKIPIVFISSSGLGREMIEMILKRENCFSPYIHIVSNDFKWDIKGKAIAVKEPIIHLLNKEEVLLKSLPFYEKVAERKKVILLGDSLDDIDMVAGFPYECLIKIAFLSYGIEEQLPSYKKSYDVIILNDSSARFVLNLVREIIK